MSDVVCTKCGTAKHVQVSGFCAYCQNEFEVWIGGQCAERDRVYAERDAAVKRCAELERALLNSVGDDLCWFKHEDKGKIPPREEFLQSCSRFHEQIAGTVGVLAGCDTIAQLERRIVKNGEMIQGLLAEIENIRSIANRKIKRLRTALSELLDVIAADDLIPESVSYMREAREALVETSINQASQRLALPKKEKRDD